MDTQTLKDLTDSIMALTAEVQKLTLALSTKTVAKSKAESTTSSEGKARSGQRWNADEEKRMLDAFKAGKTTDDVADAHNRTASAIEARMAMIFRKKVKDGATVDDLISLSGLKQDVVEYLLTKNKPLTSTKEASG